jgi:prophage maintenance system killer protein
MSDVIIYTTSDKGTEIEVKFDNDSVWLSQAQMVSLFESSKSNISEHLKHIFQSGELDASSTVRKSRTVQQEGSRSVKREVEYYNLDAIISVGYRVNTKRGVQFRQWATRRLNDYLVKGYALNEKRLQEMQQNIKQLEEIVRIVREVGLGEGVKAGEAKGLIDILGAYTKSFILLSQYDSRTLQSESLDEDITYEIKYHEAKEAIAKLKEQLIAKNEASNLFGHEKDDSFQGLLGSVVQTFGGEYLYPSIEEQAGHLIYFVIKNHPFNDGNKRIGAFLFIWFLDKNKHRFKTSGELKINDNALVALALLVAQSDPADKDIMIKLIINLIKDK